MKKITLIIFVGLCIGIGLSLFRENGTYTYITLKNNSNKNIKSVKIIDDRNKNNQNIENIKNGESKKVKFHIAGGEAGYTLEVIFEDGTIITGGAGYIEKGYRITETIKSNKIESKY